MKQPTGYNKNQFFTPIYRRQPEKKNRASPGLLSIYNHSAILNYSRCIIVPSWIQKLLAQPEYDQVKPIDRNDQFLQMA